MPLHVIAKLHPEEPAAGPWRVERIANVFAGFAGRAETAAERILSVAIDGRSSSGKTTLARRIAEVIPATVVVHTDDIAWFHSRFGWADLAVRVLQTARSGEPLSFRPPACDERHREGAIVLPRGTRLLLLEGVGSSREELAHLLDGRLWVQADRAATDRRDDDRVAAGEVARSAIGGGWPRSCHSLPLAGRGSTRTSSSPARRRFPTTTARRSSSPTALSEPDTRPRLSTTAPSSPPGLDSFISSGWSRPA
jgi:hypothetical protein